MRRRQQQAALDELAATARRLEDRLQEVADAVSGLRADQAQHLAELREAREELRTALGEARTAMMDGLRTAVDDEATMRRLLRELRAGADYDAAWDDPEPLVSIVLPTYNRWRLLEERAVPSALAQTYENIEVVIVGDAAPPEMAEAIARIADPRVRYENLAIRGPYPDEYPGLWFVAGTNPVNRAMWLARGRWIAFLNDDDALYPEHVELLLEEARRSRAEVAYGKLRRIAPDGSTEELGSFPPGLHVFGWQLALQHVDLRMFEYELAAATFGEPGDWHRTRRMLRAGVRFSQIDRVTCDYYPNLLWNHEQG